MIKQLQTPIDVCSLSEAADNDALGCAVQLGRALARHHVELKAAIKALKKGYGQVAAHVATTNAINRAMPLIERVVFQRYTIKDVATNAGISPKRLSVLIGRARKAGLLT